MDLGAALPLRDEAREGARGVHGNLFVSKIRAACRSNRVKRC